MTKNQYTTKEIPHQEGVGPNFSFWGLESSKFKNGKCNSYSLVILRCLLQINVNLRIFKVVKSKFPKQLRSKGRGVLKDKKFIELSLKVWAHIPYSFHRKCN